jgi:Domain of unknown function (DUF1802)
MLETIFLDKALCLSIVDIAALLQGRVITVLPKVAIQPGWSFLLYPQNEPEPSSLEQHYRSPILPLAQAAIAHPPVSQITAWARCEFSQLIPQTTDLSFLSSHTLWTSEALHQTLKQQHLFLTTLRIFHLPEPLNLINPAIPPEKLGKFVGLSALCETFRQPLKITQELPILNDAVFHQRQRSLEKQSPPRHFQLEVLQSAIASLNPCPSAQALERSIRKTLGWSSESNPEEPLPDWIATISTLADRSIESAVGQKSTYHAGTDFENIVRQSLEFLGFTINSSHQGGAGGLDAGCSAPYPVAVECKAGKSIPDNAVEELDRIGRRLLGDQYLDAVRLIIGAGKPTSQLQKSAIPSKVSIIKAMTLQKLVELQAQYPNSVNLIELKKYLQPGQIDSRIDEYIQKVLADIQLRSHIIQLVKNHIEKSEESYVTASTIHGAYIGSNPPKTLKQEALKEILIELSSPLAGFLGRDENSDRFYFLREIPV